MTSQKDFGTEYNFDGLIGPTHNFSGLAFGNLASHKSRYQTSHPRAAALQGLKKIKFLHDLGIKQGIIPPQERPSLSALRQFGYKGSDRQIFEKVIREDLPLFLTCCSAASMWTANAATISPSADTNDRRVHITPANLQSGIHRSIEPMETVPLLKLIFPSSKIFCHHPPLKNDGMLDEGAANHMRLCAKYGQPGIEIFVYGTAKNLRAAQKPHVYPARQTREASLANSKAHQLSDDRVVLVQQNPSAIDRGVFHNDVIAVSNENVLLYHEKAFLKKEKALKEIAAKFRAVTSKKIFLIEVDSSQLTLEEAVKTYFFNSQLVTLPNGDMALIAPRECQDHKKAQQVFAAIVSSDNPLRHVHYLDLTESMYNGGGPACLRLRMELLPREEKNVNPAFLMNAERFTQIENWINRYYRKKIETWDLSDFALLEESRQALDALTQILGCGSIYSFQQ